MISIVAGQLRIISSTVISGCMGLPAALRLISIPSLNCRRAVFVAQAQTKARWGEVVRKAF
jgi:hypothetical protein